MLRGVNDNPPLIKSETETVSFTENSNFSLLLQNVSILDEDINCDGTDSIFGVSIELTGLIDEGQEIISVSQNKIILINFTRSKAAKWSL